MFQQVGPSDLSNVTAVAATLDDRIEAQSSCYIFFLRLDLQMTELTDPLQTQVNEVIDSVRHSDGSI